MKLRDFFERKGRDEEQEEERRRREEEERRRREKRMYKGYFGEGIHRGRMLKQIEEDED